MTGEAIAACARARRDSRALPCALVAELPARAGYVGAGRGVTPCNATPAEAGFTRCAVKVVTEIARGHAAHFAALGAAGVLVGEADVLGANVLQTPLPARAIAVERARSIKNIDGNVLPWAVEGRDVKARARAVEGCIPYAGVDRGVEHSRFVSAATSEAHATEQNQENHGVKGSQ